MPDNVASSGRYLPAVIALLGALSCRGGEIDPISLSASISVFGPQSAVAELSNIDEDYMLLVGGGSGVGVATFLFSLTGAIDEEDHDFLPEFGGEAYIRAPFSVSTTNGVQGPSYWCSVATCSVSFTYGLPEPVHLSASAYAYSDSTFNAPTYFQMPGLVSASVVLDGISISGNPTADVTFRAIPPGVSPAQFADAIATPEPASGTLALLVFGLGFATRMARSCIWGREESL